MIHKNQFVLNSPTWSHNGLPVHDELVANVATRDGRTVPCPCTGERPLVIPRTVPTAPCQRPVVDDGSPLRPPVMNFEPANDRNLKGTTKGLPPSADAQYGRIPGLSVTAEEADALALEDTGESPLIPPVMNFSSAGLGKPPVGARDIWLDMGFISPGEEAEMKEENAKRLGLTKRTAGLEPDDFIPVGPRRLTY